jgi:hypothetical protein
VNELRVVAAIVAFFAGWAVFTVGAIPAVSALSGAVQSEAHAASVSRLDSHDRPALRACYRVSLETNTWVEDENCGPWGGYVAVFNELCGQASKCYERMILVQQRCLDRPASCFRFLPTRPPLDGSTT